MKKSIFLPLILSCIGCLLLDGCKKKNGDVWDDSSSTLGSYKRAKERVLWGSNDTFESTSVASSTPFSSASEDDFIALEDEDIKGQFSDVVFAQPKESPGEEGSVIPGIEGFAKPAGSLAQVFKNVYFNTDQYSPKDAEGTETIKAVASYLKSHPKTFVFVSGFCDQRGPEAYNQALGMRRSNSIRSLLIQEGVNPDQLYTVSFGKEKLADMHNTPEAWAKNRRAEFKIFNKK